MAIRVRLIADLGEAAFELVARLRYDVYVTELGVKLPAADHAARMLRDPLDDWGTIVVAEESETDEVIGTVRVNLAWKGALGELESNLGMTEFRPYFPARAAFLSRYIVAQPYRLRRAAWAVLEAAFAEQVRAGVAFCFAFCRPDRRAFSIDRLGFRQVFPDYTHPTDGPHHPLVMPLADRAHLERVRSPIRRAVPDGGDADALQFFRRHFESANGFTPAAHERSAVSGEGMRP